MAYLEALPLLEEEGALIGRAIARRGAFRGGARYAGQLAVRGGRALARLARRNPFAAGMAGAYVGKALMKRKAGTLRRVTRPMKKAKRPVRTRSTVYKAPTGGVLSLATRRFRRPRRPQRVGKSVVLQKDQVGQLTCDSSQAQYAGWMGFQHHDSYDALIRAACEGLTQAILAVLKVYPTGQNEQFVIEGFRSGDTPTLKIDYQSIDNTTGVDSTRTHSISLVPGGNADTFLKLVNFMQVDFKTNVEEGYFPLKFHLEGSQLGHPTLYMHRDVELSNALFSVYVTQRIDLQNQSKAATTGTAGHEDVASRLNIHSQPVRGKMYIFKSAKADVHDNVHEEHAYLDAFEDTLLDNGVGQYKGLKVFAADAANHLIAHPPKGRNIFKNVDKETSVTLGPGEVKKHYTTFKYSGTLKTFCGKIFAQNINIRNTHYSGVRRPMGGVTWFCFERAIKHGDSDLEIAFNREIKIMSFCKLRHQRHQLKRTEDP